MHNIKPVAIYLPQFHPIPENNSAWGEGFTEWTNVKKAKPLFINHYQPHEPHETIGYYDLNDPEVLLHQADMAKEHGIYGFAFYHYWFNGKRLLEKPLDNMLKTGKPDFPFCYIWANENWTKRWDGLDSEIIIKQDYSHEDDLNHIRFLCQNVFCDKRYIKINDKPVFAVYRTELFPDIITTSKIWRDEAKRYGFKDLYLIRVENFVADINPIEIGFDAAMEYAPDWRKLGISKKVISNSTDCIVIDYTSTVLRMLSKNDSKYVRYRCVFPGLDNTPRKKKGVVTFTDNSPEVFRQFVYRTAEYTKERFDKENQFLFINAWNEWGEGCHIEPDNKNGKSFLEGIKAALIDHNKTNTSDYISFLESNIKINLEEQIRLEDQLSASSLIFNSKGYKILKFLLKPFKKIILKGINY
jgi:hypothetical protein